MAAAATLHQLLNGTKQLIEARKRANSIDADAATIRWFQSAAFIIRLLRRNVVSVRQINFWIVSKSSALAQIDGVPFQLVDALIEIDNISTKFRQLIHRDWSNAAQISPFYSINRNLTKIQWLHHFKKVKINQNSPMDRRIH